MPPTVPRPSSRLALRALNRVVVPAVRAGVGSPPPLVGPGLVVLETTGRVTGRPRQVPLLAARLGSQVSVATVRPGSQWARNLQADPSATLWMDGRRHAVTGTVDARTPTTATLQLDGCRRTHAPA